MIDIKPPIFKLEIEQNILGSILLVNRCWDDIADIISIEDFYLQTHKAIYSVMSFMITNNLPVDWVSLADKLRSLGELENVGGDAYLVSLMKATASTASVRHYAQLLRQAANDRRLLNSAYEIIGLVNSEADDRLDEAQKLIFSISDNKTNDPLHYKEFLPKVFSEIMDREGRKSEVIGLTCGYPSIDKLLYGLRPSNLIILAARPSVGKTLLALNIAEHVAIDCNKSVLFVSLEMTKEELSERTITSISGLKAEQIQLGKYNQGDHEKISGAFDKMFHSSLITDDNPTLTIMDIRAKCRRIKRKYGLDLLIVDYLQLIKGVKAENETIKIGYITHGLKQIAKELNIPVMALCQLNRDIERRINKRPVMADLRQSGHIEQDADVIIFIDRKELHDESAPKGLADIYIAKNRSGQIGETTLSFRGNYCRFDNLSKDYVPVSDAETPKPMSQYKSFYGVNND